MASNISCRVTFQGAFALSTMINGHLFEKQYFFYTKRQAFKLFRAAAREEEMK